MRSKNQITFHFDVVERRTMFKIERCHYDKLEETINEISLKGIIKFITSEHYGGGEVGYTIIYETFI